VNELTSAALFLTDLAGQSWIIQIATGAIVGGVTGHMYFDNLYSSVKRCISIGITLVLEGTFLRLFFLFALFSLLAIWDVKVLVSATASLTIARHYYIYAKLK